MRWRWPPWRREQPSAADPHEARRALELARQQHRDATALAGEMYDAVDRLRALRYRNGFAAHWADSMRRRYL